MIQVNLAKQPYQVFNTHEFPDLPIKNINFIYGKNGSGKSTLTNMIKEQFCEDFHVRVFSGFEGIAENNRLDALVLGSVNNSINRQIESLKNELESAESKQEELHKQRKKLDCEDYNDDKHQVILELFQLKNKLVSKEQSIIAFCRKMAKEIKEMPYPQVAKPSYDYRDFQTDIEASSTVNLKNEDIEKFKEILKEDSKEDILKIEDILLDNIKKYEVILTDANVILTKKLEYKSELEFENIEKQEFAKKGLEIHKEHEFCSFCDNTISKTRMHVLRENFKNDELQQFEKSISDIRERVDEFNREKNKIELASRDSFYTEFQEELKTVLSSLIDELSDIGTNIQLMEQSLSARSKNIFEIQEAIDYVSSSSLIRTLENYNTLVDTHNSYSHNLSNEKSDAKEKLRLLYVKQRLLWTTEYNQYWKGIELEKNESNILERDVQSKKDVITTMISEVEGPEHDVSLETCNGVANNIERITKEIDDLISQTESTEEFVRRVNDKLVDSGKDDLKLTVHKETDEVEHYQVMGRDGKRPITNLSTGEKNIIAFLYFIESLEKLSDDKKKIIIFDDPMNSNDDTMQYLIIKEIQNLYQNQSRKYNTHNDIFICMTHNAHFYLNLKPQKNNYSKDNYRFYRMDMGGIAHITQPVDDFNTHYEQLWLELRSLYTYNFINSMLNSMRRIVETYIKFNKLDSNVFYKDMEDHKKIFDVNSHSMDDLTSELNGKDREALKNMFSALFKSNNAENHYNSFWPD